MSTVPTSNELSVSVSLAGKVTITPGELGVDHEAARLSVMTGARIVTADRCQAAGRIR